MAGAWHPSRRLLSKILRSAFCVSHLRELSGSREIFLFHLPMWRAAPCRESASSSSSRSCCCSPASARSSPLPRSLEPQRRTLSAQPPDSLPNAPFRANRMGPGALCDAIRPDQCALFGSRALALGKRCLFLPAGRTIRDPSHPALVVNAGERADPRRGLSKPARKGQVRARNGHRSKGPPSLAFAGAVPSLW